MINLHSQKKKNKLSFQKQHQEKKYAEKVNKMKMLQISFS